LLRRELRAGDETVRGVPGLELDILAEKGRLAPSAWLIVDDV
jgi:hypothetical protein